MPGPSVLLSHLYYPSRSLSGLLQLLLFPSHDRQLLFLHLKIWQTQHCVWKSILNTNWSLFFKTYYSKRGKRKDTHFWVRFMVFNATLNTISVIW